MLYASSAYEKFNIHLIYLQEIDYHQYLFTICTCIDLASASEYTATVCTPKRLAVLIIRQAISPRLAIRTLFMGFKIIEGFTCADLHRAATAFCEELKYRIIF